MNSSSTPSGAPAGYEARIDWMHRHLFRRSPSSPWSCWIDRGPAGLSKLVAALEHDLPNRLDILRAIATAHDVSGPSQKSLRCLATFVAQKPQIDDEARWALIALGRARFAPLVAHFLHLFQTGDPCQAAGAAYALGGARSISATPFLTAAIGRCRPPTAVAAIWALGQIGHSRALPTLHRLVERRLYAGWICGALADISALESIPVLLALVTDPRPNVRFLAAASIFEIGRRRPTSVISFEWIRKIRRAQRLERHHRIVALLLLAEDALGGQPSPDLAQRIFSARQFCASSSLSKTAADISSPASRAA